jgi:putative membrane protein (TIGR04086 family)
VLAALNFGALALGVAAGTLTASLLALLVSIGLSLIGVEAGPDIGLVLGIVAGLAAGGWVAGARSAHSHRFHGMVTGLVLAFVIVAVARLGGSEAPLPTVLWLAVLSIAISGIAGWLAGRRRRASHLARKSGDD